ncbi:hypothetical protein [Mastigocoleus sp. MO_188.B34]|uniref:hypothetical protein n=1 Tax=Mastigocoleus sp. MO_188.B34 TaxID=3036635 RepID=UPI00260163C1|nr:hypothetical protein [Mastigocoleus sp. MO_188.B34]MDJ0692870.1 hypothetical protein [Mastigocoleus sp. MO_188.B34]
MNSSYTPLKISGIQPDKLTLKLAIKHLTIDSHNHQLNEVYSTIFIANQEIIVKINVVF